MGSRIKVVIGVVLVVVLVLVAVNLLTGGDDDKSNSAKTEHGNGGGGGGGGDGGSEPALVTVATKRSQGKYATAAASANMKKPGEIWLRVSAAPKQEVTGQWNVSCGKGNVDMDTFTVTPPHDQKLTIPSKSAPSCIAGASAQLGGNGRVKVTILRDR
ncbi:MAG: hypothetical protein QOJ89_1231 [bacterium]|jgi:hypothetical protein